MRVHDYLDYWASRIPDEPCVGDGARTLTWAQLRDRTHRIGRWLADRAEPGSRFGVLSKNSIELFALYLGASRASVVPVPLNTRLAAPEWAYILDDTGVALLVAEPEFVPAIDGLRGELARPLTGTVVIGDGAPGWEPFAAAVSRYPPAPPERDVPADGPLYQMYTSGTTGRPKGAVLTQRAATAAVTQFQTAIGMYRDTVLMVMPLFHGGAAIVEFTALASGSATRILREFEPGEVLRILREERISVTVFVAAMLQALLRHPDARYAVDGTPYPDLKTIAYGAGPMPAELLRAGAEVFGCGFFQSYGMTETGACASALHAEDHRRGLESDPRLLLSCGRPALGTEMRIVDATGRDVPDGEVGQVLIRGPQLMQGYWRRPEATAEALRGGWMHSGDAAYRDADGYVYICDRVKDMIISGGENVYPREVEDVLLGLPGVAEAAVIGVPDERWGEVGKALVVRVPGSDLTAGDVIAHCRSRLAGYKRPHSVEFVADLPRNATGKVLKRVLREPYWAGRDRAVN
jgi:acyl-CoA synthetase (AMP-forming)/AMP-acid ligase II